MSGDLPPPFVGNPNPEIIPVEQATVGNDGHALDHDQVGSWVRMDDKRKRKAWNGNSDPSSDLYHRAVSVKPLEKKYEKALRDYPNAVGPFDIPPRSDQDGLAEVCFPVVHPILPILEGRFQADLVQALCLVAFRDPNEPTFITHCASRALSRLGCR